MTQPLLEAPTDFTAFELAEWLETFMLIGDLSAVSRTALARQFPSGQAPDAAELDELFGEVRRRAETAPSVYPFRDVDDSVIVDASVDATAYFLLLVLSIEGAPFRRQQRFNEISPAFELLTREALLGYMGEGGQARRFGWPNGDGRPEHLADAVEWLASEMGLAVGVVRDDVDEDDKDGGIDVAAWKPFADRSPSFTVWLTQCTTQATYERKPGDVKPEQWIAWIQFGQPPVIALSIPFAIPLDAKVREQLRYTTGLLLDRIRLCELLEARSLHEFGEHDEMRAWTASELALTRVALAEPQAHGPRLAKRRPPRKAPQAGEPTEA